MQNSEIDFFQQVGELSQDVYFVYDAAKGSFKYLSPAFETIWGLPVAEVLNMPGLIFDTIHPDDKEYVRQCFAELNEKNRSIKCDFRILCPDGERKFLCIKAHTITENGTSSYIAGTIEDISVMSKNVFYAEKINARKNSTLEILSHDLKGPIGVIGMMASSIEREPVIKENTSILQSVKYIQDLCKRNIALIRNLVNQEFLESSEVDLRKERADLVWAVNDIIDNYKRSEDAIAKTFIITSSSERIYVQMDTLKFLQVINNLISNAIKFTHDNGIIEVDIIELSETIKITVKDNGIGIPEYLQPYLFDRFTSARRTGLRGEEPTGLGMSIIKTIVELHGGKVWFNSQENEGSLFFIEIPKV